uniref:NADH-ubiquinone oxidoreductase chain 2 n=1 Tax=Diddensiella santjacobensis TaxID=2704139 RepID=S5TF96_9ASCO|nr:NADH dehydrogenase subunit 2 [Diddensiella santjacobensis]AGS44127.1 NADH dehydrogenase subunit 2 [Diddensiella santjacobensis]
MLTIGIITLIITSSYNRYSVVLLKDTYSITILTILYTIIILYNSHTMTYIGTGMEILNHNICITVYNIYIQILLLCIVIIYMVVHNSYIRVYYNSIYYRELCIIILLNIFSMVIFIDSNNTILFFVAIELQSYTLYIITTMYHRDSTLEGIGSTKSGMVYFLLGTFASITILAGIVLVYSTTNLVCITDINTYMYILYSDNTSNIPYILYFSYMLVIVGMLMKVGIVPLHIWLINIYSTTPTIITMYISLVSKISILTVLYSIIHNNIIVYSNNITNILVLISILCMLVGAIGGIPHIHIKRVIAYSGLTNIGYLLYSITSNNSYTIGSYILYIYQYSITHILWFLLLLYTIIYYKKWYTYMRTHSKNASTNNKYILTSILHTITIRDLYSIILCNRSIVFCYVIVLSSLIGIPPLAGFYGKYYILISGILSSYYVASIVLIISSTITTYYYAYQLHIVTFTKDTSGNIPYKFLSSIHSKYISSSILAYIISICTLVLLLPVYTIDIYVKGGMILGYFLST